MIAINYLLHGLQTSFLLRNKPLSITANYAVYPDDLIINIDATAGNVTATLPPIRTVPRAHFIFRRNDASGNSATLAGFTGTVVGSITGKTLTVTGLTAGGALTAGMLLTSVASGFTAGTTITADKTTPCQCTGSISGSVLTVSAVQSGALYVGAVLSGNFLSATPSITSLGTGTGGTGTYNLSAAPGTISSQPITVTVTGEGGTGTYGVSASQTVAGGSSFTGQELINRSGATVISGQDSVIQIAADPTNTRYIIISDA